MITRPHGQFEYHTQPYRHQHEDFLISRDRKYYGFFNEMGTGKTKTILDTAVHLYLSGEIDGVLIVADKGCYRNWHVDQIPTHVSPRINHLRGIYVSNGSRKELDEADRVNHPVDDRLDFLTINTEALSHDSGIKAARRFLSSHHAMMVVDESTSIKNIRAKRTKAIIELGQLAEYRRIATGTPITQSPLDLYAQCEFLAPGLLNHRSFVTFKNHYAVFKSVVQGRARYEVLLGYRNLEELTTTIQSFTSRRLKSECLDLPEKIYMVREVEQTDEQRGLYQSLKERAMHDFSDGMITVTHALTMLTKLHQINCGHVKDDNRLVRRVPSNRVSELMRVVEGTTGKVVIWGCFQEDIRIVSEALRAEYGEASVVEYYGETHVDDRASNLIRFRDTAACRFFVGTPSSGGRGINGLQVASDCIYYSNDYKLEPRLQSEDRLHRIGQRDNCTYTDLVAPGTVDVKILAALRGKRDLATEVLDGLRNLLA